MAQDPGILSINEPAPVIFANQTTPVHVTLDNQDPNPAINVLLQIEVLDFVPNQVFFFSTIVPLIPPFGQVDVSTFPNEWYPDPAGDYQVIVQIIPSFDVNPTNNFTELILTAIPHPIINMQQIDMISPYNILNSLYGSFCIQMPPVAEPLFLNLMAQDPIGGGTDWVVRNMPLLPHPNNQTLYYWFDLDLLGIIEGDNVGSLNYSMRIDPFTLDQPFPVPEFIPVTVTDWPYDVWSDNPVEVPPLTIPGSVTFPTHVFQEQTTYINRGCTVPNIDLDSSSHQPSPTYAGDWNACGPASAANSMQWLEDTHPLIPSKGTTHRQKMESLSGHMGRANEAGVTTTQLVKGKLGYIDECKLPIHVKYQSWFVTDSSIASPNNSYGHSASNEGSTTTRKPPTWEFLKSEMEKGEDVEILFGWYDKMANRNGGHWVTVTGVSETPAGVKGIYIKDDSDQKAAGGTSQHYHNWHTDGDWSRLLGYDGPNNYCWVESVVSESYDPYVTFAAFDFSLELIAFQDPFFEPNPLHSFFNFSYPPTLDTNYFNLLIAPFDSTPVWLGQNILLPPQDSITSLSLWMDIADMGVFPGQPVDSFQIIMSVDSLVWNSPFFDITYDLGLLIDTVFYYVGDGAPELVPSNIPFILPPLINWDSLLATSYVYRGCEIPNIDLDSTLHNPTTEPGYEGDANACGPAAAANSLQWLEDNDPNIPDTGTSHRDKLKELSKAMDRANNKGVLRKDFIEAKLEYIDNHKLPIHVKFQGWKFNKDSIPSPDTLYNHFAENKNDTAFAPPLWSWLVMEMENDEDVEVEIGYYDSLGVRRGGHWVTAAGVTEVGGVKTLYFKDDTRQRSEGGMRHQCTEWVTEATTGLTYFPEMSGSRYLVVVETVVSESYDPAITFCPEFLTLDQIPILSGTYSASQEIFLQGIILSPFDVTISAPKITLSSNFEMEQGATLTTNSTGCN